MLLGVTFRPRILRSIALAAAALAAAASATRAKPTEAGQRTYWDQLMEVQSARDVIEGHARMQAKDYDGAVREFAKAVVSNPGDSMAHLMLGSAYYWQGNVQRAETEFKEGLRLDPKSAQGHLLMGIVHAWKGDSDKAYASFQTGAALDPDRADLQMDLGSIEETMGRYADALAHFRRAAALEPEHPLYHYQLGMLYRRLGRDADAVDSLRTALKKFSEFEDAALELGASLERMGERAEATDWFRKAVKLKARDSVARYRLGRALLEQGEVKKARAVFADAFHLTPEDKEGGLALSVSFGGTPPSTPPPAPSAPAKPEPGRGPTAPPPPEPPPSSDPLDMLSRNLERIPLDQEARLQVELAFIPRPQLERARASETPSQLKRALEQAGKSPKPAATGVRREFRMRAKDATDHKAQVQQIVKELREVLKQSPLDAEVRMGMNLSFQPKSASPRVQPDPTDASTAESRAKVSYQPRQVGNDMGLWVMGTGWMALVEETLPEEGEPDAPPATTDGWVARGLGYAALGQAKSALKAFDRAVELDSSNEQAWLGRAVALVESGREAEAEAALERVLKLHPKNRPARDGLKWLRRVPPGSGSKNEEARK